MLEAKELISSNLQNLEVLDGNNEQDKLDLPSGDNADQDRASSQASNNQPNSRFNASYFIEIFSKK